MLKVLYIDDEPVNLLIFEKAFEKDFIIYKSFSPREGIEIVRQQEIDIVVTDMRMPEMNGIEVIREVKKIDPQIKCILLTAYYEPEIAYGKEFQSLVYKYLSKPFKRNELRKLISEACS